MEERDRVGRREERMRRRENEMKWRKLERGGDGEE